jgi:DNA-binding NarL/FixJ family response regulator
MDRIRIVLAEDYPVVRIGIHNLLERQEDFLIVGEAASGDEAVRLVTELKPDVLLLDMELPGCDGVEVTRSLIETHTGVHILVLSAYEDKEFILSMLELGASGYLLKDEASELIVEAVRKVAQGEHGWISRRIAVKMSGWARGEPPAKHNLTPRELEVLSLVVDGKTNQFIAKTLNMSEKTVEAHMSHIFAKLKVSSRTDAAVAAVRDKLI